MIIVSICGASGSGKTSLARNIVDNLKKSGIASHVLTVDSYYICHPELPFHKRTLLNYDGPDAFDFAELKADIHLLSQGYPITTKIYDYATHLRCDTEELIYPPDVLLIEGIHSFSDKDIINMSSLSVYVDTDPDVCVVRRMCRDTQKRKRTVQAIAKQYLNTVKPMYEAYIRQYKYLADICVVGGGNNAKSISVITCYIKAEL